MILGLDTSTPATAIAVLRDDGSAIEAREDPPAGSRGEHSARLLPLLADAMEAAGATWADVERLAVGVGPGGFTGLRIGIATARGLAQARGLPLVGVSSLHALALGAMPAPDGEEARPVLAVIDARRGEVFAAAWLGAHRLLAPHAMGPDGLGERVAALLASPLDPADAAPLAVGDGAIRFRSVLERAGAIVPPDDAAVHRMSAVPVCRLGAAADATTELPLPDYGREPDAQPR